MTQSVTIVGFPLQLIVSRQVEFGLVFGQTLSNFSTLQYNINNGAGWFNVVAGVNNIVSATLTNGGLGADIVFTNTSAYASRILQFRETVSGALSNTCQYYAVSGMKTSSVLRVPITTSSQIVDPLDYGVVFLTWGTSFMSTPQAILQSANYSEGQEIAVLVSTYGQIDVTNNIGQTFPMGGATGLCRKSFTFDYYGDILGVSGWVG